MSHPGQYVPKNNGKGADGTTSELSKGLKEDQPSSTSTQFTGKGSGETSGQREDGSLLQEPVLDGPEAPGKGQQK